MKTIEKIKGSIELVKEYTEAYYHKDYYIDGILRFREGYCFGYYSSPGPVYVAFEGESCSPREIKKSEFDLRLSKIVG